MKDSHQPTLDDRASIVAFLTAEAARFDAAAPLFIAKSQPGSADRCIIKAGHTRTLATQIARGDDRNRSEQE